MEPIPHVNDTLNQIFLATNLLPDLNFFVCV